MMREKKLALGTVALRMGALRFLYKKTLRRRDIDIEDLPLVRAPQKLPVVLSPEEVIRLIEGAANLWHRTILMLLYATGLRRAEAAHLKVSDIDSALMLIHVHQGKGSRDRDLPLTAKLLEALREYWRACLVLADNHSPLDQVRHDDRRTRAVAGYRQFYGRRLLHPRDRWRLRTIPGVWTAKFRNLAPVCKTLRTAPATSGSHRHQIRFRPIPRNRWLICYSARSASDGSTAAARREGK
jgi:integrase